MSREREKAITSRSGLPEPVTGTQRRMSVIESRCLPGWRGVSDQRQESPSPVGRYWVCSPEGEISNPTPSNLATAKSS